MLEEFKQGSGKNFLVAQPKTRYRYIEPPLMDNKAVKKENKETLIVEVNGVKYDADSISINYMTAVVALANCKYNQAQLNGASEAEAYEAVYKSTIAWKNADNEVSNVQIESIVEALEMALGEIANIVGV